ncbi:hypothetical protein AY601_4096 [Pedobacter cryoconitis]|uniref:Phage abortive infection protein n=2 Tax=Pedobacter cryoconitis TaxID=188932 RepID=A0A127VI08_9SPHI|nr:hypothetical protein AY601_4096 [Pedobacter cryoconitis]
MIMGILAVISFCSLILIVFPAFIPHLDLSTSKTANIGSTLGGVIGPIVSMFSAYLIYEALMAQQEGNRDQRIKGDSDIIFLLLNQLEKEYNAFELDKGSGKIFAYDAIASYANQTKVYANNELTYNSFIDSLSTNRFMYIVRSFMMIRERVALSNFSYEMESMFIKKLEIYYRSRFKFPVKHILDGFGDLSDDVINEIKDFQIKNDVF